MSVFGDILRAVQSAITGLNLNGSPRVVRRKQPIVGADDVLPLVLVCPEPESVGVEATESLIQLRYPVRVLIVTPGNQLLETDVDRLLDWRETIRHTLHRVTLVNAATVFDAECVPNPPFDPSRYPAEIDVSPMLFTFTSQEDRELP